MATTTDPKKLAVVTGASSGIGLELAAELGRHDYDLIIVSNDEAELDEARQRLRSECPGLSIESLVSDLATFDGVKALWEKLDVMGRPIDVLAANAGIGFAGPFAETSLDDELRCIDLNVAGQVHLVKRVLNHMLGKGSGRILITASLIALSPGPFMAIYAASKAFLHSFGLAIRNELQKTPVSVTVLMPGATESEFWDRAEMRDTNIGKSKKASPADVAKEAVASLEKGSAYVVPGIANKVRAALTALTPDTALAQANRDQGQKAD